VVGEVIASGSPKELLQGFFRIFIFPFQIQYLGRPCNQQKILGIGHGVPLCDVNAVKEQMHNKSRNC
jgi:hypothetical protein